MKGLLKAMKKKESGIPANLLPIFECIVQNHQEDDEFRQAMNVHLTKEQRYRLYETFGSCNGTGHDKKRKAFAADYAHLALDEKISLFAEYRKTKPGCIWKPILNDDNTLTLIFKCTHGYYKRAREGMYTTLPPNVELYFEGCAGGRLYELQKALGIKLKINSVDVSPLSEDVNNPVVFIFEIVE